MLLCAEYVTTKRKYGRYSLPRRSPYCVHLHAMNCFFETGALYRAVSLPNYSPIPFVSSLAAAGGVHQLGTDATYKLELLSVSARYLVHCGGSHCSAKPRRKSGKSCIAPCGRSFSYFRSTLQDKPPHSRSQLGELLVMVLPVFEPTTRQQKDVTHRIHRSRPLSLCGVLKCAYR